MSRLEWGNPEDRVFESGVDRGVLYVDGGSGVSWNGLVSVTEKTSGGEPRAFYYDGEKFKQTFSKEVFEANIEAYTYPDEFGLCEGLGVIRPGFKIGQQRKKPFHLCYRTIVGDGVTPEAGYKLHLIYNAWAYNSERERQTNGESTEALLFSWEVTTVPVAYHPFSSSSYFSLDSREIPAPNMRAIENILYGTEEKPPRMPTPEEVVGIVDTEFSSLTVIDHEDGTFTVSGNDDEVRILSGGKFIIDSDAVTLDGSTYTVTSET